MTNFTRSAWNSLSFISRQRCSPRSVVTRGRSMYSSMHDASFITVMDDGYDASKYGYRIFIPSSPNRTNVGGVVTSSNVIRKSSMSSSAQQYQSFHHRHKYNEYDNSGMTMTDEYSQCMQSIDPSSLDILSSPEVLAILESQRDWETYKNDAISPDNDDPYVSEWEVMKDGWNFIPSCESFDMLPSIDEKKM